MEIDNTNPMLKMILAILVTALVVGGGVYLLVTNKANSDKAQLQSSIDSLNKKVAGLETPATATTTTTPATTATDPTADWKTYSNSDLGFSIKYPTNLTAEFTKDTNTLSIDDPTKSKPNAVAMLSVSTTSVTLDQFLADLKAGTSVSGEQKTTLAGATAYEGVDLGIISQYGLYSVANGKSYTLRFPTNNKDTLSDIKSGLSSTQKLIINSLKFIK